MPVAWASPAQSPAPGLLPATGSKCRPWGAAAAPPACCAALVSCWRRGDAQRRTGPAMSEAAGPGANVSVLHRVSLTRARAEGEDVHASVTVVSVPHMLMTIVPSRGWLRQRRKASDTQTEGRQPRRAGTITARET